MAQPSTEPSSPAPSPGPAPDYELAPTVEVSTPQQLKAIGDATRSTILSLLNQRAATTSQLAEALQRPRGSVGHHLKVLEAAGLVRVVRRRKVRALTEKYYGRTARTFLIMSGESSERTQMVEQALAECVTDDDDHPPKFTIRHAQIPAERASEFVHRLVGLAEEFTAQPVEGDVVFGFLAGVYATRLPTLAEDE